jgi:hypothetical protein
MAVEAETTRDIERQNNPVANFDTLHGVPDLSDDTHNLVTNYCAGIERRSPFIHMKIAAADPARGHAQDRVIWSLQLRSRMIRNDHLVLAFVTHGFHTKLLFKNLGVRPFNETGDIAD